MNERRDLRFKIPALALASIGVPEEIAVKPTPNCQTFKINIQKVDANYYVCECDVPQKKAKLYPGLSPLSLSLSLFSLQSSTPKLDILFFYICQMRFIYKP